MVVPPSAPTATTAMPLAPNARGMSIEKTPAETSARTVCPAALTQTYVDVVTPATVADASAVVPAIGEVTLSAGPARSGPVA